MEDDPCLLCTHVSYSSPNRDEEITNPFPGDLSYHEVTADDNRFTVINHGTNKGGSCLIDSRGYRFTKKTTKNLVSTKQV